jgi:UDP-3-O-[3-hydroxymyristoyl] glucosamine N-acyltransferase
MPRLSDAAKVVAIDVLRDGAFASLGNLDLRTPERLVFVEGEKYAAAATADASISCVITGPALADAVAANGRLGVATAENPRAAFFRYHNHLAENSDFYWRNFDSEIAVDAVIHPNSYVAPLNVRIGRGCVIEPGVTVLERSVLGEGVILRAGSTIGSQGFEFKRLEGTIVAVAHAGGARLSDGVEVQANSAISRSIFGGFTQLGEETKLDNLVHVAHNVTIGRRCFLAACAMIAGSVIVGDDVWIGPGASISSGVTIGDGANVTIGAVVTRNVPAGAHVSGNFAIDHDKFIAFLRSIR